MRITKKEIILEWARTARTRIAGAPEIRALQGELRQRLGPQTRTSPSYIANVLREAGIEVQYEDRYVDPALPSAYAERLAGILQFGDLAAAEAALRRLDEARRDYQRAGDRKGVELVRSLALKGKLRAQSLAANPRVRTEKRREKQEIADWFRVWLETPDLFADWLDLRKRSQEFQELFLQGPNGRQAEKEIE